MTKIHKFSLLVTAIAVIACGSVWAHNVAVFAWVEGDTVHVEGKFGGGRRPVNVPVTVYGPGEDLLLSGVTDENGAFSFKVPQKTEMSVVLTAGMGHKGEWTIPLSDLEGADAADEHREALLDPEPVMVSDLVFSSGDASALGEYVTAAELHKAVDAALDKKLKPMMKLLVATQQSGPSVTDILGGIGYILGLVGVAAYFGSRRRKT